MLFKNVCPGALDKISLSIGRVNANPWVVIRGAVSALSQSFGARDIVLPWGPKYTQAKNDDPVRVLYNNRLVSLYNPHMAIFMPDSYRHIN